MITENVQRFCVQLWERRETGAAFQRVETRTLIRSLIAVLAKDVEDYEGYDPGSDRRYAWATGLLTAADNGLPFPKAAPELEATAGCLLGKGILLKPDGKALAARNDD